MSKLLVWNVRGARDQNIPGIIHDLKRIHHFEVLVVSEPPEVKTGQALDVLKKLGFSSHYVVDAIGFSGGLWILWNDNLVHFEIIDCSKIHHCSGY